MIGEARFDRRILDCVGAEACGLSVICYLRPMNFTQPAVFCPHLLPRARLKVSPADFVVDEVLGYEPTGSGEHIWIQFRKTGCNTRDVIDSIARLTGVAARNIGYSGLKDRQAITTQWLSVPLPMTATMPQFSDGLEGVEILRCERSDRKLRIGTHKKNRFQIVLRDVDGDMDHLAAQLDTVSQHGFPNYFGAQRFGRNGQNLNAARSMFAGKRKKLSRFKRGLYLSATRAWLFNRVLEARVKASDWLTVLDGDVCMLEGSQSIFSAGLYVRWLTSFSMSGLITQRYA